MTEFFGTKPRERFNNRAEQVARKRRADARRVHRPSPDEASLTDEPSEGLDAFKEFTKEASIQGSGGLGDSGGTDGSGGIDGSGGLGGSGGVGGSGGLSESGGLGGSRTRRRRRGGTGTGSINGSLVRALPERANESQHPRWAISVQITNTSGFAFSITFRWASSFQGHSISMGVSPPAGELGNTDTFASVIEPAYGGDYWAVIAKSLEGAQKETVLSAGYLWPR